MNGKVIGTVTIEQDVTDELVNDILITAFEGGSDYWIDNVEIVSNPGYYQHYADIVSSGGELIIRPDDEEEVFLNNDNMLEGIKQFCIEEGRSPEDLDYNPPDANEADSILQYAVFGQLIYG